MLTAGDTYKHVVENDADAEFEVDSFLLLKKLHPSQVLACLRMLGCGNGEGLRSHLMQVSTGEGKSIILGCLATVLALMGKKVTCVCYSKYLSTRDYADFQPVFKAFGVLHSVAYCTIKQYVDTKVDVRKNTEDMVFGGSAGSPAFGDANPGSNEVLLVDEVDVFFGDDFLGKTYNPIVTKSLPEARKLLEYIWENKKCGSDVRKLYQIVGASKQFKAFRDRLGSDWSVLAKKQMEEMCGALHGFVESGHPQSSVLDAKGNRIGYVEHDAVSYTTSFGYRTAFEYQDLAETGQFSDADEALDNGLVMKIHCGQFSYAHVNLPGVILGVSGTVDDLTTEQRQILQQTFHIDPAQHSRMPSVFGKSNLRDTGCLVCAGNDHALEIAKAIKDELKQGRAVLVFFETQKDLDAFAASAQCSQLSARPQCLSEVTPEEDRSSIVFNAATKGHVTLCTASFGRGTDFISNDAQLLANGGVHVIQAFFSTDQSEQTQIKGRTARQGQKGSYSMILSASDLESKGLKNPESAQQGTGEEVRAKLESLRKDLGLKRKEKTDKELTRARRLHEKWEPYFTAVKRGDLEAKEAFRRALYSQ